MAIIAWTDVTALAVELSSVAVSAQTLYLALANDWLNVSMFDGEDGPRTKMARIYIAAHFATLDRLRGLAVAGPVISESRGGLSRSYANLFMTHVTQGLFGTTTYGQNYEGLVRTSRARFPKAF